ncbi:hypothetical protein M378DRAFT_73256 [Amanita muscaria Koide BX008]|uniref:Cytoplasmic tRNA 2-thiolation protein 2 n=1 Tax=Amanita muscaria (strain Koide BX008) TaxID=946122 RepID=A0A0C2X0K8_AMAMK|nr:hypothetical protein M378DRAFT_73256 [Amanita muscaria Koide BX008]
MSCDNPAASVKEDEMLRRPKFDKSRDCVKCKENRGNIVVRHAVFCKACFFPFVTAKFKRALDPYINEKPDASRRKTLKASGNLLLGFSGGLGSTVLLDIVNESYLSRTSSTRGGKNHPRNDQVWDKIYVCYVETSSAISGNEKDRTEEVRSVLKQYENIDLILLRIEDAFDPGWWAHNGGDAVNMNLGLDMSNEDLSISTRSDLQSTTPVEALRLYLSSLPTPTAIATSIQVLVRRLLLQTAQAIGSSHLLLGTSLTSLSIAHISSVAQGGGFFVREEAQEEWAPFAPSSSLAEEQTGNRRVRIIRPLKDVGMKECGVWAWWRGLHVVGRIRYLGGKHGIGSLTRDFIIGLEADYPSTVSSIARTCAKVTTKEEPGGRCAICDRPSERDVEGWKSRISIRDYSELVDSDLPPHLRDRQPSTTNRPRTDTDIHQHKLTPRLCYSCHTTLLSKSSRGPPLVFTNGTSRSDDLVPLPVWVIARLQTTTDSLIKEEQIMENEEIWHSVKMDQTSMKETIGRFLLTDD